MDNGHEVASKGKILCVLHQEHSTTGRIGQTLRSKGYEVVKCRHACGDPLPEETEPFDGIVIFGGPMSANDTHLEFIRGELDWLVTGKPLEVPFLGVCLGAQLLARAMGGEVGPHEYGAKEIGYHEIMTTPTGKSLMGFDKSHVFQWHSEGIHLGDYGETLAFSQRFNNQAFSAGANILGIQFHLEMFPELMARWYHKAQPDLTIDGVHEPEHSSEASKRHFEHNGKLLNHLLDRWLAQEMVA
ncbi:MAG TPA: glutamine amidotransferase [Alphaproteobacteria bacterium]|nr:glutamine amidotransferase [Paracoccaceae bacterium]RCL81071.1 MAG: glutamine amidotransferase [SAR116 cluster bacterium]RPH13794.1 MAG: glutamine amidotransferase [Alphaproteobacteria bacterium TMED150]HBQ23042.1 glutamine amidotransferase [Alphaproteobacteria bacterium]HCY48062.1 glutamine amidotransferase [Alphaproteobacteria bacterium]|tara:strand:- start:2900 stop:3628 length:729 start_codon:yes stop_codon:yes gene_type:complete